VANLNERKKIEDRIRKKEAEIQELEMQAREGRVYVQALQDVLKMLPKEARDTESGSESASIALREGSLASQARDAILKLGRPVHVSELLAEIGKEDTRENKTSLSGTLAAYVRKREIFSRPAPNRFGLVELGHTHAPAEVGHPPDDFGEIE
jgi:hypothetical protein